jgi:hypothetical protein
MRDHLAKAWDGRDQGTQLRDPYEALILASIIEKETALPSERKLISGVFQQRLRRGMRLQTDPTVIYGIGETYDGNLRRQDLERDTPYNTYTRAGLPPTPIALPGNASLEAAVQPQATDALYFVATGRGDGSHAFYATLEEHDRACVITCGGCTPRSHNVVRGAFVTLEGGGVGKTTNLTLILAHLDTRGVEVVATREPGSTPLGETIRGVDTRRRARRFVGGGRGPAHVRGACSAPRHRDSTALAAGNGSFAIASPMRRSRTKAAGEVRTRACSRRSRLECSADSSPTDLASRCPLEVGRRRIAARAPDHFEREQAPFFEGTPRLSRTGAARREASQSDRRGRRARASAGRHRPRARRTARSVRKMTEPALQTLQRRLCPWLKGALSRLETAYAAQRLGHAWLIAGPAGSGKLNLALAFARPLDGAADTGSWTRRVVAAYRIDTPADHHPDLHWLFPEEDKTAISVEQIRGLSAELSLGSAAGRRW